MKKQLQIGIATLLLGGLIYVLFRSKSLIMFKWIGISSFESIRSMTSKISLHIPDWILYSLPDGLWIFSYTTLILVLWKNKITYKNIFWIFSIPLFIIFHELFQLINIVKGTFDALDLTFYLIGTFLPIILYSNIFKLKPKHYEKEF